jgi:SAM-dependent methyltransferase
VGRGVSAFKDHFSKHAADYHSFRPVYPPTLFDYLASLCAERTLAWDCGTGNGQAAIELAKHFDRVIATDASAEQLRQAEPHPRIEYSVAPADRSPLAAASVDLVCVAQALHWFDFDPFYAEVRRVAKPGGVFAAICYGHHAVNPAIDAVSARFQGEYVGPHWHPERRYVEDGYQSIPFPFEEIATPPFELTATWPLAGYLGYLSTWSATKQFVAAEGFDPVAKLAPEFAAAWGDPAMPRAVRWKLNLRVGRVN